MVPFYHSFWHLFCQSSSEIFSRYDTAPSRKVADTDDVNLIATEPELGEHGNRREQSDESYLNQQGDLFKG